MRAPWLRSTLVLAFAMLAAAACTGDGEGEGGGVEVVNGTTVAVEPSAAPGWLGATGGGGTTAASGPVVQGSFSADIPAGAATITISGYSCDVVAGAWTATVRVAAGGEGSTSLEFAMPAGKESANADWSFDGTWEGAAASFENDGTVHKAGSADRPRIQFFGLLTVTRGTEEIRGPANAATGVDLGVVEQCS